MLSGIFLPTDQVLFLGVRSRDMPPKGIAAVLAGTALALIAPSKSTKYTASECNEGGEPQ